MSGFKKTNISLIIILLILILLRTNYFFSALFFSIPFIIYTILLFFGSKNICSQFYTKVKCTSEDKSKIHLTFDDGPHPKITPEILKILKKNNQKATFFCIGKNLEQFPETAKQIINEGHTIGNHSYSHSWYFDFFRTSKVTKELLKTNTLIKKITGENCKIFRPPYGITNPNIARAVKKLNMKVWGWNIRSLDTVKDKNQVLKRLQKAKPGDIVLFHDTKLKTPEILDNFLRLKSISE
ncbi:MAG: polysaccharide deacetylase family protein [Chlorobi bacterium]|nr:polysaccharide deacetylase family protein [Chlorobiota bacterium]